METKANELKSKIETILEKTLPTLAFRKVWVRRSYFGGLYIGIGFAANDTDINRVEFQKPQLVTLNLDVTELELTIQSFGCMGGGSIYLIPDKNHPKEKYLAMAGCKIPFRKPKKEEKFVLNAIEKFALNWIETLKTNKERLMYQNIIDYDLLLKSY